MGAPGSGWTLRYPGRDSTRPLNGRGWRQQWIGHQSCMNGLCWDCSRQTQAGLCQSLPSVDREIAGGSICRPGSISTKTVCVASVCARPGFQRISLTPLPKRSAISASMTGWPGSTTRPMDGKERRCPASGRQRIDGNVLGPSFRISWHSRPPAAAAFFSAARSRGYSDAAMVAVVAMRENLLK
jgi:hypothetical protein